MTAHFHDIVIVGHLGKMGAMLMRRLRAAGHRVRGMDRDTGPDEARQLIPTGDVVLLCVPVSALRAIVAQIAPLLRPGQLLADITSVKTLPLLWMEEAYSGPVVGTHPLFGPEPNPADMRVALVPGANAGEEHLALVEGLFRGLDCSTFRTSAHEHDSGVAFAQSLNFTISAAFFALLARQEKTLPDGIQPFLTPSFKRHMEAARKHLTQDTAMFCEFTAVNPCFPQALQGYQDILSEAGQGRDSLAAIAREAAMWYDQEKP